VFLCSHLLAEVEQLCTKVGVIDRGRLVLEDHLSQLRAATGRVLVRSPDADRAAALLDGRVDRRDGDRFFVRHPDSAQLNRLLVFGGIRVSEITVERRSLEQVVLDVTSSGSDRVDAPAQSAGRGPLRAFPRPRHTDHLTQRKQTTLSVTIPESQDRRATLNAVGYQSQMAR
jgi:ABC-2 type transport system ATP-binding protein